MNEQSDRLDRLERRVAELEGALAALGSAEPARSTLPRAMPPPAPATADASRPPVETPSFWAASGRTASALEPSAAAGAGSVAPADRSFSLAELEERLSGRVLAWAGGIALIVGGVFLLSLAFNRGWIGPEARVLIGLLAAAAALGAGAWLFDRGYGPPALALVAVGVAVGMLALYAASALYSFIPAEAALVGSLILAIGAATIAVRADSELVAGIGLLAVIAAPPVMGARPDLFAVLFLGTVLVGTTGIALWRSWSWLPALALLGSAPQVSEWLATEPPVVAGLAGIAGYWAVNAVAAGGQNLFRERPDVHRAAAAVLVLDALFAIAALGDLLAAELPAVRVAAYLLLAAANAAMAAPLLARSRGRHSFGELAAGVAVGTIVIAIGLDLGGIFQPIAWAAVATGLAWSAIHLRHARAGVAAAITGSLAVGHFVAVEYPWRELAPLTSAPGTPFASPEGIVLATLLASVLVVTLLAARSAGQDGRGSDLPPAELAYVGGAIAASALTAWAAAFELPAFGAVIVWSALAAALFAMTRPLAAVGRPAVSAFVAGSLLVVVAAVVALSVVAPLERLTVDEFPGRIITPLLNPATPALVAIVLGLVVGARTVPRRAWATWTAVAAATVATWLVSVTIVDVFQAQVGGNTAANEIALQAQVALSIAWVLGGAAAFAVGLARRIPDARLFGLGLIGVATAKVFLFDLASLDVAYRVLSFMGLGVVLLASSFLAIRLRAQRGSPPSEPA